jgi:hypothetical protein
VTPRMVVSHDQLMHLRLEWLVRQPLVKAIASRRESSRPLLVPSGHAVRLQPAIGNDVIPAHQGGQRAAGGAG